MVEAYIYCSYGDDDYGNQGLTNKLYLIPVLEKKLLVFFSFFKTTSCKAAVLALKPLESL